MRITRDATWNTELRQWKKALGREKREKRHKFVTVGEGDLTWRVNVNGNVKEGNTDDNSGEIELITHEKLMGKLDNLLSNQEVDDNNNSSGEGGGSGG